MVRKAFFVFFIVFSHLFLFVSNSYAQDSEDPFKSLREGYDITQIPGIDCGVAGVEERNMCCNVEELKKLKQQFQDESKMEGFINSFFNILDNPVIESIPGIGEIAKMVGVASKYNKIFNELKNIGDDVDPPRCFIGEPDDPNKLDCKCITAEEKVEQKKVVLEKIQDLCRKYTKSEEESNRCFTCMKDGGYFSAIGCLYFQPERFLLINVFGLGVRLAGLYVFLCIIYSAIQIQLAGGNPEKLKSERERLTSCIIGLLIVLFSVFILRIVGVNILSIPGLG